MYFSFSPTAAALHFHIVLIILIVFAKYRISVVKELSRHCLDVLCKLHIRSSIDYCIRSSDKLFRNHDFFSEKIIVGPHEGVTPPPLAQMVLTQCASISELLVHHMAPPGGQI